METAEYIRSLRRIIDLLMISDDYTPAEKLEILYAVTEAAQETGKFIKPGVN